jgi:hypothetical protein
MHSRRSTVALRLGLTALWVALGGGLRSAAADRSGIAPGWLPPEEATAFFPDDAFTLHTPGHKQAYLRTSFELPAVPRRAVLAVRGWHTVAVLLNGSLVAETYGIASETVPSFAAVTAQLKTGSNTLDLRVWSEWTPTVYLQLRLEAADGSFTDVISDASWEWSPAAATGWPRGPAPNSGWQAAVVLDDYYGKLGQATKWVKEFALLPRALLQQRLQPYNDRLRAAWPQDRDLRKPEFRGPYRQPAYAAQYGATLRIDPTNGQMRDATGQVRHFFFNIYQQTRNGASALEWVDFDFTRLEDDLDLMEASAVHPYLRFLGWQQLLDAAGNWRRCDRQPAGRDLPRFTWNYEILDYFLDRCQAHGRFVAVEGDFFWSASWDTLPSPYHTRYYLYPEVAEASALAHRKLLARYADCTAIAGFMIGEEDVIMDLDLENGHLRRGFQTYLRERYGTLENLAQAWRRSYDYTDRSDWKVVQRRPEHWGQAGAAEDVLLPRFPLVDRAWGQDWSQIDLPRWPKLRWPAAPEAELPAHMSFPGDPVDTDDDPVWIDYNAYREDGLYLQFVSRWAEIVREAVPRHWLFHSNAEDYTSQWHFLHFQRRAELPFTVIGVGNHDSGKGLNEIPPWYRVRKLVSIIAAYRPYALAPGSPAMAISSGEGEGGRPGDEQGILDYYRGQSFEMVGHGAAFEMSYAWAHLAGGAQSPDGSARQTKALEWMGGFYRALDGVSFSLPREVPILIVRNNALQRSNRSGRDYGNALGLVSFLAQLNLEFDTVMDLDLVYGRQDRKVDLGPYRVIFLPGLESDYPEATWQALDAWLTDPAYQGQRTLVVGYAGQRTPYLAPTAAFHPVLAGWLGTNDYAGRTLLRGSNSLTWQARNGRPGKTTITINFGDRGDITPLGLFAVGEPVLALPDGRALGVALSYRGNTVYAFGFPLGLAFDNLWGLPYGRGDGTPATQEPEDVMATLYEDLLDAAGLARPVRAPHNVRVACSDDLSVILVRELAGRETTDLASLVLPAGAQYAGCELVPQADGRTLLRATLPAYGGLYFKRRQP